MQIAKGHEGINISVNTGNSRNPPNVDVHMDFDIGRVIKLSALCSTGIMWKKHDPKTAFIFLRVSSMANPSNTTLQMNTLRLVHNRRLILVSPFPQPWKQVWSAQVWKTMTTITLWALWCNRLYDVVDQCLLDVLLEIWENLLVVVHNQYDNMQGSPEIVNKRRKKLLHLWKKLPLFTESTQGPQWHYQLPWTLSWIPVNHGRMQQQTPTPFTKSYLWF